jgi:hypothetical protein
MGGAHATTDRFDTFVEQLAAPAPRRRVLLGLGGLTWALRDDWRRTSRQRPRIVTSGAAASARTGSQSARTAAWIAAPITNEPAALRHDQGTNRHEGWSEGGCAHTTSAVPGDRPTRGHVLNRTSPFSSSRSPSNDQGFVLGNHYVPNPSVLVALEPSTYRDAIADALALLRPGAGVVAVDPADLAAALVAHHPALVFLSDPAPAVEAEVPAWVLLHPSGANRAIATLGSAREEIDQPCLADLLALLDRALTLVAP